MDIYLHVLRDQRGNSAMMVTEGVLQKSYQRLLNESAVNQGLAGPIAVVSSSRILCRADQAKDIGIPELTVFFGPAKPKELLGRVITGVRKMTKGEMNSAGWLDHLSMGAETLQLDDGSVLFPSMDEEGNGPGALFGAWPTGEGFQIHTDQS